jgi:hypothetical protein
MSDAERDHDDDPYLIFRRWYSFGSPVGLAILLVGLGAFLALLGAAVALPIAALR